MHRNAASLAAALLFSIAYAQTSTKCNPLHQTCPADKALGGTANIDFTQGQSNSFTASGNGISYGSNGLQLTIKQSGDAPTLTSNFYIMFGKVDVTLRAAPGTGIVTSSVLQSDDLDEIDWEFLGGDSGEVQSNYFGKGVTGSYDRATSISAPNNQNSFNTYTIDWNANQLEWLINGNIVRQLTAASAGGQYPQTPMQVKIGTWAGGDPSANSAGTVSWAGGDVSYGAGPFSAYVKSINIQDYSTGTQYTYSDQTGSWQSIKAAGGSVNGQGGSSSMSNSDPPTNTQSTSGQPSPFEGTHADPSSAYTKPSVYPWVATGASSFTTSSAHAGTSIPSLPSGWSSSDSGSAVPASSAAANSPATSSSSFSSAFPSGGAVRVGGGSGSDSSGSTLTSGPAAPTYGSGAGAAASSGYALPSGMATATPNGTAPSSVSPSPAQYSAGAHRLGTQIAGAASLFGLLALIF